MWYRYANVSDITPGPFKYLLPFEILDEEFLNEVDGLKQFNSALIDILGLDHRICTEVAKGHRLWREVLYHGLREVKSNS